MTISVTIDTNVINAKGKLPAMNKLEEWYDQGKICLFINDVMEEELTEGSIQYHKQGKYIVQCLRPGRSYPELFEKFKRILFPTVTIPKLGKKHCRDIAHIIGHQKYLADIFLTDDDDFIRCREKLAGEQVLVMTPNECVVFLKERFRWN